MRSLWAAMRSLWFALAFGVVIGVTVASFGATAILILLGLLALGTIMMLRPPKTSSVSKPGNVMKPAYNCQDVIGEELIVEGDMITGQLAHWPIVPGTVVARIYCESKKMPSLAIAFTPEGHGTLIFNLVKELVVNLVLTTFDSTSRIVTIKLLDDVFPAQTSATVSYEYLTDP